MRLLIGKLLIGSSKQVSCLLNNSRNVSFTFIKKTQSLRHIAGAGDMDFGDSSGLGSNSISTDY